jgi:hypothetical protein
MVTAVHPPADQSMDAAAEPMAPPMKLLVTKAVLSLLRYLARYAASIWSLMAESVSSARVAVRCLQRRPGLAPHNSCGGDSADRQVWAVGTFSIRPPAGSRPAVLVTSIHRQPQ